ncbi:MAG: ankyrin repeat domain-containing protein [Lentisphaeria bacterium]|nr:ankyrin repeat domain-containing protein [Lentisphaeria bacterium]NQZ68137.1 ankyrin repeat domain-containing protein [Lentisphaeria bacterium]
MNYKIMIYWGLILCTCSVGAEKSKTSNEMVKADSIEKVKALLAKGIDINSQDKYGRSSLYFAAGNRNFELVQYLVKNKATVNLASKGRTPLHRASTVEIAGFLIKNGADVNKGNKIGITPLHDAARFGKMDIVKLLIKNGAKLNIKDKFGRNSVYWAYNNTKVEMAEFLISKGVKNDPPKRKRNFKESPLIKNDPRLRFIICFKTVMEFVEKKDIDSILNTIIDGSSPNFEVVYGQNLNVDKPAKFIKKNFLFNAILTKNMNAIKYGELKLHKKEIKLRDRKNKTEFAGQFYFIPVLIPGITDDRFDALRFIDVNGKPYWLPFGW